MIVPQFVPSEVCLSCDGCCRFKDQDSLWRPKVSKEEVTLAQEIFSSEFLDDAQSLKTVSCCDGFQCTHFEKEDNTCRIYLNRPFECRLYPFVLTSWEGRYALCMHLSCPYIQLKNGTQAINFFVKKLEKFFYQTDVINFLKNNPHLFGDYTRYSQELKFLFWLEI